MEACAAITAERPKSDGSRLHAGPEEGRGKAAAPTTTDATPERLPLRGGGAN
jgi:hypothetical protein